MNRCRSWTWWLLLVSWLGRGGRCPQGADGTQTRTSHLRAELRLYFLLDGHLSNWRVTNYSAASRTVELNQAWSPHSFYSSVVMGLPIQSWLQIFPHICPWATAEVHTSMDHFEVLGWGFAQAQKPRLSDELVSTVLHSGSHGTLTGSHPSAWSWSRDVPQIWFSPAWVHSFYTSLKLLMPVLIFLAILRSC